MSSVLGVIAWQVTSWVIGSIPLGASPLKRSRVPWGKQGAHHHDAGNHVVVVTPQVERRAVDHVLDVIGNRLVRQPALDPHAAFQASHLGPHMGPVGTDAEAFRMQEEQVGEVQQVVVDQLVVGLVLDIAGTEDPVRVVQCNRRGDQRRVGLGRIAHPYPYPTVLLDHREAAHAGLRRDAVLAGHLNAFAAAVEFQAVVHAAHGVAFLAPDRQRRGAVAAAVPQGGDAAIGLAEQYDRFIDDWCAPASLPARSRSSRRLHTSSCAGTWVFSFRVFVVVSWSTPLPTQSKEPLWQLP